MREHFATGRTTSRRSIHALNERDPNRRGESPRQSQIAWMKAGGPRKGG
jgi:hypothetical protein